MKWDDESGWIEHFIYVFKSHCNGILHVQPMMSLTWLTAVNVNNLMCQKVEETLDFETDKWGRMHTNYIGEFYSLSIPIEMNTTNADV